MPYRSSFARHLVRVGHCLCPHRRWRGTTKTMPAVRPFPCGLPACSCATMLRVLLFEWRSTALLPTIVPSRAAAWTSFSKEAARVYCRCICGATVLWSCLGRPCGCPLFPCCRYVTVLHSISPVRHHPAEVLHSLPCCFATRVLRPSIESDDLTGGVRRRTRPGSRCRPTLVQLGGE